MGANGIQGKFYGLPLATLTTMLSTWQDCLNAVAVAGQSYTISGRQFTRANLSDVVDMIAELQAAIDRYNGTRVTQTYPNFRSYPNQNLADQARGNLT